MKARVFFVKLYFPEKIDKFAEQKKMHGGLNLVQVGPTENKKTNKGGDGASPWALAQGEPPRHLYAPVVA